MDHDGDVTPRSNASMSPFRSARTRTPDRRRSSSEFSREVYVAEVSVSPFHPSRSCSPAPYNTHDRGRDYRGREVSYVSWSPFHPSRSLSPPPYTRPRGKDHFEADEDEDITPCNSPPVSHLHRTTSGSPPPPYYSSSDDEDSHSTYLFPEIRSRGSSTPVHYNYKNTTTEMYRELEPPELPDESESLTLQEIAKMRGIPSYKKEEIQLEACVAVANYKVRQSVSATLQAILDKHGDIAASSKLQSTSTRSFYLESLAAAVMELRSTALRDLTKTRVAEMAAVVKDMDSVKIDVSWLKTSVTELVEAVECFGRYEEVKMEKEECGRGVREGKVKMEELTEELRRRENETNECRERVTAMAGRLGQLEMKETSVNKKIEIFQSKVHKFEGDAVLVHL